MIISALADAEPRPRLLAVGTFDGVHLGHREVIRGADTVLTFDPHPRAVTDPRGTPPLLTTFARKAELIAGLGVEELVVIPFDRRFSTQTAHEFQEDVLVGRLGATRVSVGANFRYGARAQGNTEMLEADGRFEVRVVPLLEVDRQIVSSSRVRGLIAGGDVQRAGELLGAPFSMGGEVVRGECGTLGRPTVHFMPDRRYAAPAHGDYACRVHLPSDDEPVAATARVGVPPRSDTGLGARIEVHFGDQTGDLCRQQIRVDFLGRIRGRNVMADLTGAVEH